MTSLKNKNLHLLESAYAYSTRKKAKWLSYRNDGSEWTERWLSFPGMVAHFSPDYSANMLDSTITKAIRKKTSNIILVLFMFPPIASDAEHLSCYIPINNKNIPIIVNCGALESFILFQFFYCILSMHQINNSTTKNQDL